MNFLSFFCIYLSHILQNEFLVIQLFNSAGIGTITSRKRFWYGISELPVNKKVVSY